MALDADVLTSEAEVRRRWSSLGLDDFADDPNSGTADQATIDDCMNYGSADCLFYLQGRYTVERLQQCRLVRGWATNLAVWYACTLGGNDPPKVVQKLRENIEEKMEDVKTGRFQLPGVPIRSYMTPTVSNIRIDRRYPHAKSRVIQRISTQVPQTLTHDNVEDPITGS